MGKIKAEHDSKHLILIMQSNYYQIDPMNILKHHLYLLSNKRINFIKEMIDLHNVSNILDSGKDASMSREFLLVLRIHLKKHTALVE